MENSNVTPLVPKKKKKGIQMTYVIALYTK